MTADSINRLFAAAVLNPEVAELLAQGRLSEAVNRIHLSKGMNELFDFIREERRVLEGTSASSLAEYAKAIAERGIARDREN